MLAETRKQLEEELGLWKAEISEKSTAAKQKESFEKFLEDQATESRRKSQYQSSATMGLSGMAATAGA